MFAVDVYKNVGEDKPFDIESFTTDNRAEAMQIFKRELDILRSAIKYPKISDKNGLIQVKTNRGRLIGEIEVTLPA